MKKKQTKKVRKKKKPAAPLHEVCAVASTKLKLSPHPHVPLTFGLLKTNPDDALSFTKSISVPTIDMSALGPIKTFSPTKTKENLP